MHTHTHSGGRRRLFVRMFFMNHVRPVPCAHRGAGPLRRGVPSTVQGLFTWPEMQYSLVPWFLSRPKPANHGPPLIAAGRPHAPRRQHPPCTISAALRVRTWTGKGVARPRSAPAADGRGHRDGLHIGHRGGAAEEADVGWEWRLEPGLALLALNAFDQRRLLAANVRASAAVHVDVKGVASAARVLAKETRCRVPTAYAKLRCVPGVSRRPGGGGNGDATCTPRARVNGRAYPCTPPG